MESTRMGQEPEGSRDGSAEWDSRKWLREEKTTPGRPTLGWAAGEGLPAGDPILRAKTGGGRQWSLVDDREQLSPPHLPSGLWEEKDGG